MKVTVNGKQISFCKAPTGEGLLEILNIPAAAIVAELNGEVIKVNDLLNRTLEDGDVLELVTVVGGG